MEGPALEKRFAALSGVLGTPAPSAVDTALEDDVSAGYLTVRASGASAARLAIEASRPPRGVSLTFPDCALRAQPAGRQGVVLTVATARLSISFNELRPLLFRPVPVDRPLQSLFYIKEHLADPALSADRIADALFISRRRLYQLFDDGEGVSGRIRALRVDRARELLGDPAHADRGIGEISRQCGFANAAHFSRTFRKTVGETPRGYRDRLLG